MTPRTRAMAIILAVAVSGSGCGPSAPNRQTFTTTSEVVDGESEDDIEDTVFAVRTTTCGTTNQQRAVAVAIGPTTVATVAHVFADTDTFRLEKPAGRRWRAELIWLDAERDLALARLDEPVDHWLDLGTIGDGAAVRIVTLADGEPTVESGRTLRHVNATLDGSGERAAIELEAAIDRGESGSPVVGPDGTLVAMVFAASRGEDRGWALDATEMETALAQTDEGSSVSLSCR